MLQWGNKTSGESGVDVDLTARCLLTDWVFIFHIKGVDEMGWGGVGWEGPLTWLNSANKKSALSPVSSSEYDIKANSINNPLPAENTPRRVIRRSQGHLHPASVSSTCQG